VRPAEIIFALADRVAKDEAAIGVLSTGEQIAVALVLDRKDLLPGGYSTMLEAVERLGTEWFRGALIAQRCGDFHLKR
jgi:hypothetical protein